MKIGRSPENPIIILHPDKDISRVLEEVILGTPGVINPQIASVKDIREAEALLMQDPNSHILFAHKLNGTDGMTYAAHLRKKYTSSNPIGINFGMTEYDIRNYAKIGVQKLIDITQDIIPLQYHMRETLGIVE